ncbi:MAG: ATPase, partial [Comamonadaceae bacterium]
MSKPYRRGLVVGKFCPLHLGHEFLIRQAMQACDALLVLGYTSQRFPGCEPERRAEWLRLRCPDVESHVLGDVVAGRALPDDADDGDVHRRFVAWWLMEVRRTTVDAVFTSEAYG